MTNTKKFSEFTDGGTLEKDNIAVGLESGTNTKWTVPTQFLEPGGTADRPGSPSNGDIRYNTDLNQYEYYDAGLADWLQLESSSDISALIARLAAHTAGDGASMIGLEDQGAVSGQTVQELSEADYIVKTDTAPLANGFALSTLTSGILGVTTATGDLLSRTITGTTNKITVSNGDGQAGDPTITVADNLVIDGNESVRIPTGITGARPVGVAGDFRYNLDTDELEYYDAGTTTWKTLGTSSGTIPSIGSSTDNAVVRWNGTGGNAIQDSSIIVSDTDAVSGVTQLDVDNLRLDGNTLSSTDTNGNINVNPDGSGLWVLKSTVGIDAVIDDDTMATATATNVPTAESVVAYVAATPGGAGGSTTQVQYNNAGTLDGDSGFTTNGAGSVNIVGDLDVDNITLDGNEIRSNNTNGNLFFNANGAGDLVFRMGGTEYGRMNNDVFFWNTTTAATNSKFNIVNSTAGIFSASTNMSDTTPKIGSFGVPHYTNSEELLGVVVGRTTLNDTIVDYGGGDANLNAATLHRIYAAANNTTTVGTQVAKFDINGFTLNTSGATTDIIRDEDDMVSDDANALATQQSIKAYVDSKTSGGGYTWVEVTTTSQSMAADTAYIANNAGLVTLTLPLTASVGQTVIVQGKGAGGWSIAQNSGQTIHLGSSSTTTGVGGSLSSTNQYDSIELVCITANDEWASLGGPQGSITVV